MHQSWADIQNWIMGWFRQSWADFRSLDGGVTSLKESRLSKLDDGMGESKLDALQISIFNFLLNCSFYKENW